MFGYGFEKFQNMILFLSILDCLGTRPMIHLYTYYVQAPQGS